MSSSCRQDRSSAWRTTIIRAGSSTWAYPAPTRARGGKHVILPPGFKGKAPEGYFAGKSASNKVLIAVRSLPVKGDVKGAMDALRSIRIYPLASAADPKLLKFVDISERTMDGTCLRWEDNIQYWQKLHEIID